jgi:hypothetical protein
VVIVSASYPFVAWIQNKTAELLGIRGAMIHRKSKPGHSPLWELKYSKKEALQLFRWIYYAPEIPALARKRALAELALTHNSS